MRIGIPTARARMSAARLAGAPPVICINPQIAGFLTVLVPFMAFGIGLIIGRIR